MAPKRGAPSLHFEALESLAESLFVREARKCCLEGSGTKVIFGIQRPSDPRAKGRWDGLMVRNLTLEVHYF